LFFWKILVLESLKGNALASGYLDLKQAMALFKVWSTGNLVSL
jgi:hypothetical protein